MKDEIRMFKKANYDVMDDICSNLSIDYWAIYMILFRHMNSETGNCYPSLNTLAKETNLSKSTIQRRIDKLEEAGYIKHNSGTLGKIGEKNMANSYYFLTKDKNDNIDTVAESMAHKKKKTYKNKDKYENTKDDLDTKNNKTTDKSDDEEDDNNCFDYKQKESYQYKEINNTDTNNNNTVNSYDDTSNNVNEEKTDIDITKYNDDVKREDVIVIDKPVQTNAKKEVKLETNNDRYSEAEKYYIKELKKDINYVYTTHPLFDEPEGRVAIQNEKINELRQKIIEGQI